MNPGSHSGMAAVLGNRSSVDSNATSAGATSLVRQQKVASGWPPGHIRCPNRRCPNRSCLVMPPAPVAPGTLFATSARPSNPTVQNAARPPHAIRHLHELRGPAAPPRILQADHQQIHACRLHRGSALGERSVGDSETCGVKGPSSPCKSPCSRGLILKAGTSSMYVSGQFEIRSPHRREPSHENGRERSAPRVLKQIL